ncbi:MAG: DUF2182 domain-containing protein [Actinobacteria bacterium]|nr:DUF2182 domain-containing protein [Actinomycetota bacterium]
MMRFLFATHPAGILARVVPLGTVAAAWIAMLLMPTLHHSLIPGWFVMVIAMMIPTVLRPMRKVADDRVSRATVFLAGYSIVWVLAAAPLALLPITSLGSFMIGGVWMLAGVVQVLPSTARALHACRGLRRTDGPWGAGVRQGIWCVRSCWLLMVATVATASLMPALASVGLMIIAAAVMLWEKSRLASATAIRGLGIAFIVLGAAIMVLAPGTHLHG